MKENHNKLLITIILVTIIAICVVFFLDIRKNKNQENIEEITATKEVSPQKEESPDQSSLLENATEDSSSPTSEEQNKINPEEPLQKADKIIVVEEPLKLEIYSKEPTIKTLINTSDSNYEITYYNANNQKTTYKTITKKTGTYKVKLKKGDITYERTIIIVDTTKPVLKLKKLNIEENQKISLDNFVSSCQDNSKEKCKLTLLTKIDTSKTGTTTIKIQAEDSSKNKIIGETKLTITKKESTTATNEEKVTPSTPPAPTKVETKIETSKEEVELPYGVKKILTKQTTYDIYSDGTKKNYNTIVIKTEYDYSGYNGTTETLTKEAIENKTKYKSQIDAVVSETNKYRNEVNESSLILDENLTTAAMIRSLELAYTNKLSHTRPNGTSTFTLLSELGITYWYAGENIAYGYSTAEKVTLGWKNSQGHYQNMINSNYGKIGVGYANINGTPYWVQIFTN